MRITSRGQSVLQSNPPKIDNKFLLQFEEFRQFRERAIEISEEEIEDPGPGRNLQDQKPTPDETMRLAYREIESALAHDLLERIREAPPALFERLFFLLSTATAFEDNNHGSVGHFFSAPVFPVRKISANALGKTLKLCGISAALIARRKVRARFKNGGLLPTL